MLEFKPPAETPDNIITTPLNVFLAGTIDNGDSSDWQLHLRTVFEDYNDNLVFYNPRRDDWDASWTQSIDDPQFYEQVSWELDHLEKCDLIVMFIGANSKSPISLLELGLHAGPKMVVCCEEGFYRKGNVDIVCERKGIPMVKDLEELTDFVRGIFAISEIFNEREDVQD
jgi:hypothetical protein